MEPEISVIVTTYNRRDLLKETVLSILSQTFTKFELIIIDNNSSYDFFELIKSFNDARIRAYQNSNNGIIAINRNYGIKLAIGKYIALCDDDDLWEPTKLEQQINIMDKKASISLICTDVSFINLKQKKSQMQNSITTIKKQLLAFNIIPAKYLLIFLPFVTNSSVLFRKRIIKSVGYIDETPDIKTIEDYDYWFRAALDFKIYFLNKKLVQYRLHEQQLSLNDSTVLNRTLAVVHNYWPKLDYLQRLLYRLKKALNK